MKVRLSTVWVRWPFSSRRFSTVRTVDSLSGRDRVFWTVSAEHEPCCQTRWRTSRSRSPRSETLWVIVVLHVVLRTVAKDEEALNRLAIEGLFSGYVAL